MKFTRVGFAKAMLTALVLGVMIALLYDMAHPTQKLCLKGYYEDYGGFIDPQGRFICTEYEK